MLTAKTSATKAKSCIGFVPIAVVDEVAKEELREMSENKMGVKREKVLIEGQGESSEWRASVKVRGPFPRFSLSTSCHNSLSTLTEKKTTH